MELGEYDYEHLGISYGEERPFVIRRCLTCGRFLKEGQVFMNGLDQVRFEGWICQRCGEVEPFYEFV